MNNDAEVRLWGRTIGAVTWLEDKEIGVFQYAREFLKSGIQLSPLQMPLREFPYQFPALPRNTFKGLPGLLSDSLPDRFGNAIIDAWLASRNRTAASFHPVERLCYIGSRGMGALEFHPAILAPPERSNEIDVQSLVELANRILDERAGLQGVFTGGNDQGAIEDILRVGTSAAGARAKAIIAWNPTSNEFRSGQIDPGEGFQHWLMKFDGVQNNRDKELNDPTGYGKIEYAYYLMAIEAGITMSECRLHHESGRSHFMTKRFDRTPQGGKIHMLSLEAMAHFDHNQPAAYSYEQAIQVIRQLNLPHEDRQQQVLRAVFNVVARNQDDHVKNIAFLMNRKGEWRLSPAFDISYSWNPSGAWTSKHQMSLNGKRDDFTLNDLMSFAKAAGMKNARARALVRSVIETVRGWPEFAEKAGVEEDRMENIAKAHRIDW